MLPQSQFSADVIDRAVSILSDARSNGGGTYAKNGTAVCHGFVVGGSDWHRSLVIDAQWPDAPYGGPNWQPSFPVSAQLTYKGFDPRAVHDVAAWLQSMPARGDGSSVTYGVWRDADGDNRIYLDCCDVYGDEREALAVGYERHELAIFDLAEGESIETGWRLWQSILDELGEPPMAGLD